LATKVATPEAKSSLLVISSEARNLPSGQTRFLAAKLVPSVAEGPPLEMTERDFALRVLSPLLPFRLSLL